MVTRSNMCPAYQQHPKGKELPISTMGMFPLVIRDEKLELIGGVELQIIETLAKKFDFKPSLMPATSFNMLVDMVINNHMQNT